MALCAGRPTNDFHDTYEANVRVARAVDDMCLSCPVMAQCLRYGVDNGEWGVWGSVYLTSGKVDKVRNMHKSDEVWNAIAERIGDAVF